MTTPPALRSIPLFPLGTVLFPGGLLPLRIFEVRYLDMIGKCHRTGEPFGVVSLTQGSEVRVAGAEAERFSTLGTLAEIREFTTPQPGLMQIECVGTQRFRIRSSELQKHGLWTTRCAAWSRRWKSAGSRKATCTCSFPSRNPIATAIADGLRIAGASCCRCRRSSSSA